MTRKDERLLGYKYFTMQSLYVGKNVAANTQTTSISDTKFT